MKPRKKPARKQCAKCPWKVTTNPYDIPDGYDEAKHCNLSTTIASGDVLSQLSSNRGMRIMACHETPAGDELPCVGWLMNQLGPGNNIPLRIAASSGRIDANVELDGEQHECFEDTLP